jgi:hypothetical protein
LEISLSVHFAIPVVTIGSVEVLPPPVVTGTEAAGVVVSLPESSDPPQPETARATAATARTAGKVRVARMIER